METNLDISHMLLWFDRITDHWLKASAKPVRMCSGENVKIIKKFEKRVATHTSHEIQERLLCYAPNCNGFLTLLELKIVSVNREVRTCPFLPSLRIFWTVNQLKSGCKRQYGEQAEGGPCYWNACGQWDQKAFLMVSQVTGWIGSDVAKKPSEGAVRKDPVIPCSWIKPQQMKDNEIQEKNEMFTCWKIICSEPNLAFQNTLTESEFTLVHNSISQGLCLCFKGQPQNLCWNGSESSVSGQMITVTWLSVPIWSAKIGLENSKSFLSCSSILAAVLQLTSREGELNKSYPGISVSLHRMHGSASHQSTVQIAVH